MPTKSQTNASYANDTRPVYVDEYGAVGDGVTDDTAAFNAAFAASSRVEGTKGKVYLVNDLVLNGATFVGNGCKLRAYDSSAKWVVRLTGFYPQLLDLNIDDPDEHVVTKSTISSNVTAGDLTINVTDTTGVEAGMVCAFYMEVLDRWHVALVDTVSAGQITLINDTAHSIDASPDGNAISGNDIIFSWGMINVKSARYARLEKIISPSTSVGIVSDHDTSSGDQYTNEKHLWNDLTFRSTAYIGAFIGRECHDCRYSNIILRGAKNKTDTFTGDGFTTGPYSPSYPVWQYKNLNVFVDGVKYTRVASSPGATEYTVNTSSQVTFGSAPAVNASIELRHSERTAAGWVIDSTGFDSIRGGNTWVACESLGFARAAVFRAVSLTRFTSCILDSCLENLYMKNCDKVLFVNLVTSFADVPLNVDDGCLNISFSGPTRIKQPTDLATLVKGSVPSDPIRLHTNSSMKASLDEITDDSLKKEWFEVDGTLIARGIEVVYVSTENAVPAGTTTYIGLHGENASLGVDVIPQGSMYKKGVFLQGYAGGSPGSGETFQYELLRGGSSTITTTTSDAASSSEATGDYLFDNDNWQIKLTTSSSASSVRHRVAVTFI